MNLFLENHQGGIGAIWVACGRAGTCWQIGGGLSAAAPRQPPRDQMWELLGTRQHRENPSVQALFGEQGNIAAAKAVDRELSIHTPKT